MLNVINISIGHSRRNLVITCFTLFVRLGTFSPLAICMLLLEFVGASDLPFVDLFPLERGLLHLPLKKKH